MTLPVIGLVLLAAALHASWNALVKAGGDKLVVLSLAILGSGLPAVVVLPFVPFPDPASWPYLLASVLIHQGYYFCLVYAYKHGDLSQVYPIARGAAPLMVGVGAWVLAGEVLSVPEAAGIAIASAGIMSLAFARRNGAPDNPKAILFALGTGVCIAGYSLADGMGVRRTPEAASYIAWMFALEAPLLVLIAMARRRGRVWTAFRPHLLTGLFGGLIAATAYGIVIWAMSLAPIAHVVALRETSVILAAIIGTAVLGEPFGRLRVAAAAIVAAGAALLQIGG
jgi:drug/metabolite transporter (DMT)-like permease